jgi:hypothetical protein
MKRSKAEPTSAENLEAKFDRGEEVIDYFETQKAKTILPQKRAPAQYLVELPAGKQTVAHEDSGAYGRGGSGKGAATGRTQAKNPKTGDYAQRETPGSKKKGEFIDNKKGGKPFKGVAKEPDKRRK